MCHWSRREIESNSFTCRRAKGQEDVYFFCFFNPPNYILKVMLIYLNLLHIAGYSQGDFIQHTVPFLPPASVNIVIYALIPDLARPAVITSLPSLNTTTDKCEELGHLTHDRLDQPA